MAKNKDGIILQPQLWLNCALLSSFIWQILILDFPKPHVLWLFSTRLSDRGFQPGKVNGQIYSELTSFPWNTQPVWWMCRKKKNLNTPPHSWKSEKGQTIFTATGPERHTMPTPDVTLFSSFRWQVYLQLDRVLKALLSLAYNRFVCSSWC